MLKNVSPKVTAQTLVTIFVGVLVSALLAIKPEMLTTLGIWAPVAGTAITALAAGLSGYFITDPVRQAGEHTLAVHASIAAVTPTYTANAAAAAKGAEFDQIVSPTPAAAPADGSAAEAATATPEVTAPDITPNVAG